MTITGTKFRGASFSLVYLLDIQSQSTFGGERVLNNLPQNHQDEDCQETVPVWYPPRPLFASLRVGQSASDLFTFGPKLRFLFFSAQIALQPHKRGGPNSWATWIQVPSLDISNLPSPPATHPTSLPRYGRRRISRCWRPP